MIKILYTDIEPLRNSKIFDLHLARLPVNEQSKILAYIRTENRCQRLASRLLLAHALSENSNGLLTLSDLQYNTNGKPYLENGFNFSISHSGDFVLLAIIRNLSTKIGIDIEKIKDEKPINDTSIYTQAELQVVMHESEPIHTFYKYWTIKESISKAIGTGLYHKFSDIEVTSDTEAFSNSILWSLKEIKIKKGYICFLSASEKITDTQLTYLSF